MENLVVELSKCLGQLVKLLLEPLDLLGDLNLLPKLLEFGDHSADDFFDPINLAGIKSSENSAQFITECLELG